MREVYTNPNLPRQKLTLRRANVQQRGSEGPWLSKTVPGQNHPPILPKPFNPLRPPNQKKYSLTFNKPTWARMDGWIYERIDELMIDES